MKIYFAGGSFGKDSFKLLEEGESIENILISFAYRQSINKVLDFLWEKKLRKDNFMIDSGAFSAWNKGDEISIEWYSKYLNSIKNQCQRCFNNILIVNLDVIPASRGKKATQEQVEQSAQQGFENFKFLRERHANVIPVFHQGEDLRWLDVMIQEAPYIGISPSNDASIPSRSRWLEDVFNMIDIDKTQTHGFAVTSRELMTTFPFTSVDSATWRIASGFGDIMTPYGRFHVTDRRDVEGFEQLPIAMQDAIKTWLASYNYTIEQCKTSDRIRAIVNFYYIKEAEKEIASKEKHNFRRAQMTLFEPYRFDDKLAGGQ